ncbi:MAG: inositol monophosphatase family protein [Pseudomonadales bacterium]
MQPMLNIALRAARQASEQIVRASEKIEIIRSEKDEVANFITEAATKAEQSIAHTLQKAYPNHLVIGEFTGEYKAAKSDIEATWHISAVDSVANFSAGLPNVCICLAAVIKGKTEHAMIINSATGEEFSASRGHGAVLNGRRIRASEHKGLEGALLASGFDHGKSTPTQLESYFNVVKATSLLKGNIQNTGSAALNFAYTAAGRFDGAFASRLQPAAALGGALLAQEAGCLVADLEGGANHKRSGDLVAANAKVFKPLIQALR